jgi:hypothetical protein
MHTVLDLDLDFFVWPIAHERGDGRLPVEDCEHLATGREVRDFLEQRCHLRKDAKIPGQEFVEHEDAFRVWRRWINDGKLTSPFRVFHVDAHADLGMGDSGWVYLSTELLALPLRQRVEPRFASKCLTSSNYLAFAIANRWIDSLTYVFPTGPSSVSGQAGKNCPVDLLAMHFRNGDPKKGLIELKHYRVGDEMAVATGSKPAPLHIEPPVPFNCAPAHEFRFSGFTHFVVAQSPRYTPPAADKLLEIIREYISPA